MQKPVKLISCVTLVTLLEANKNARRARILAAARTLLEKHGYAGVTMRGLADESQVSVPTLYNLFGGKEPLLLAAVEERFVDVLSLPVNRKAKPSLQSVLSLFETMNAPLIEAPRYSRTMIQVFMGTAGTRTTSMRMARAMGERLATLLFALKKQGTLVAWIDGIALAQRIGSHYLASVITWGTTRQSTDVLRATTEYELCLALLGAVAHKRDRDFLQKRMIATQPLVTQAALAQTVREDRNSKTSAV